MKKSTLWSAVGLATMLFAGSAMAKDLNGAGGTAIYPVLAKWADAYKQATGTAVNYQAIGSGGGIQQITAKTVDFANSDKPLTPDDLGRMKRVARAKIIRRALGLTQEQFAAQFRIPLGTLRDWEQGAAEPDAAARAYLHVIARNPKAVTEALAV